MSTQLTFTDRSFSMGNRVYSLLAASKADLHRLVRTIDGTITAIITPEIAGWLLEMNTHNRRFTDAQGARCKAIMVVGKWKLTGEPIIVSIEGTINDGQHRLYGVVESGEPQVFDVRFGIPQSAMPETGIGVRRPPAESLRLMGCTCGNLNLLAATARGVYWHERDLMRSFRQYVEPRDINDVVYRYPWLDKEIVPLQRHFALLPGARQAWFFVLLAVTRMGDDRKTVETFAEAVGARRGDDDTGPVLLHDRLRREQQSRAKQPPGTLLWLGAKAWNAYAMDRRMSKLQLPAESEGRVGEHFPGIVSKRAFRKGLMA